MFYNDCRLIPDEFMDSGEAQDGKESGESYIDASLRLAGGKVKGICCGIAAKSTNDASGLAQIKIKPRGGNSKITHSLVIGEIHPIGIARVYPSDANGVILYYR
jgi:hypothetical protein